MTVRLLALTGSARVESGAIVQLPEMSFLSVMVTRTRRLLSDVAVRLDSGLVSLVTVVIPPSIIVHYSSK